MRVEYLFFRGSLCVLMVQSRASLKDASLFYTLMASFMETLIGGCLLAVVRME